MLERREHQIDLVIALTVDDAQLKARMARRFAEGGRPDDNAESFEKRLVAYNRDTAPLLAHYRAQGKLVEVDGMASVDAVAGAIDAAIEGPRF
jgi:adenylate kinase